MPTTSPPPHLPDDPFFLPPLVFSDLELDTIPGCTDLQKFVCFDFYLHWLPSLGSSFKVVQFKQLTIPELSLHARSGLKFDIEAALLHDSTAARVGALFQLLVQDTTAQDFGLPSSAIRLRM